MSEFTVPEGLDHYTECEHEPPRDRWQRPVIEGTSYRRPSTMSKALEDLNNIIDWKARTVAVGMALDESLDLREMALTHSAERRAMDDVVERAVTRAQPSAADRGTALHAAIAAVNRGNPLPRLPRVMTASIDAYRREVFDAWGLVPVAAEVFLASEDLLVAGTADVILYDPEDGTLTVGDIKTGAKSWERKFPGPVSIQMACYAAGRLWCPEEGWGPVLPLRRDVGLLLSVPVDGAECHVDTIDLKHGLAGLGLAEDVRTWRSHKPLL